MIWIKTDSAINTLARLNAALSRNQLAVVVSRAINRTLNKARTTSRREVKKVYNISQKDLGGIDYKRANAATQTGKLFASRKPIPLDAFAPKQETAGGVRRITKKGVLKVVSFKRPKKKMTSGVSIEIFRGKREVLPNAFMLPGGAVRVFMRGEYRSGTQHGFVERHHRVKSDGNDTPIKPLITVSLFGEILNDQVMGNVAKEVKREYPVQLVGQMTHMLQTIS